MPAAKAHMTARATTIFVVGLMAIPGVRAGILVAGFNQFERIV